MTAHRPIVSYYKYNKARTKTTPKGESMTDQSSANDTDVNVIVKRYKVGGQVAGAPGQPMYGDFSNLPTDLRALLEHTRGMNKFRQSLPEALRDKPVEELLMLSPDDITRILTPPDTPPATKTEEEKK